jgi:hypothetical protein
LTLDVAHWLRRWALWTSTCSISGSSLSPNPCQPFCLSSHLFNESSHGDQLLASPPFSSILTAPCTFCCVLVFSSLFIQFFIFVLFFCSVGGPSAQGTMLVYPRGGWRNTTWCLVLTYLSAKCLLSRFGTSILWQRIPPVFSV